MLFLFLNPILSSNRLALHCALAGDDPVAKLLDPRHAGRRLPGLSQAEHEALLPPRRQGVKGFTQWFWPDRSSARHHCNWRFVWCTNGDHREPEDC